MHIAYITNIWGNYYGHYLIEQIVKKYPQIKIDVYFCSRSEKNRHYKIVQPESSVYKMFYLKGEISWGIDKHFNFGIFSLIFNRKYDIYLIGGYSYPTVALAIIIARLLKRRYILLIDHMYKKEGWSELFKNILKKFLIRQANAYITTSQEAKDNLVYYGADKNKIFIAPLSCADFFYLDFQIEDTKFQKPFDKYLLFVGRFEEYKGVRYLLEAFKIIRLKYQDIGLVLIGSGSLEQEIKKWIDDNQLNKWIKIINWLPYGMLPLYYRKALMFICPSTYEVWAFVVNEAMASGLPVIASDAVGAARALIQDGKNGFIVKQKSSKEIAIKIQTLLENSNLRQQISHNAYETAKQYSIDRISNIYYQVFNFVLNQR